MPTALQSDAKTTEVLLWQIEPEKAGPLVAAALGLLQPTELDRMRRMRASTARDEFILGRACLRVILGAALDCAPIEVGIAEGREGKPFVPNPHFSIPRLHVPHFNVAHSGGHILIAMSREAQVGIDLERMDANVEILDIAAANFCAAEVRAIDKAWRGNDAMRAFYQLWTGKEAVLKAHGSGLSRRLDSFDVSTLCSADCPLVPVHLPPDNAVFYVQPLKTNDGFAAALATSASRVTVRRHVLRDEAIRDLLTGARLPAVSLADKESGVTSRYVTEEARVLHRMFAHRDQEGMETGLLAA